MEEPWIDAEGWRRAAAVVPIAPDGRVLGGRRGPAARSYPGYFTFAGGGVDMADAGLPVLLPVDMPRGLSAMEVAAGLRELGEESGCWSLARRDGTRPSSVDAREFAASLETQGERALSAVLDTHGLLLDGRGIHGGGVYRLPRAHGKPGRPAFAVRQMLLDVAQNPLFAVGPYVEPAELTHVAWQTVAAVAHAWRSGERAVLPPVQFVLERLASAPDLGAPGAIASVAGAISMPPAGDEAAFHHVVAGCARIAVPSPTLPPATTTNAVVLGHQGALIVDPAGHTATAHALFDAAIDGWRARGGTAKAVVLTHHHPDHVGDAVRTARRLGIPVWAHADTAALVDFAVDRMLADGDVLHVEQPDGTDAAVHVLHTPGHAPGHVCFHVPHTGVLVAGDMVAAEGTILIARPRGDLGAYMRSLERLMALGVRSVIPAHGPLLMGDAVLGRTHAHREARLSQIHQLCAGGAQSVEALVRTLYAGLPSAALPYARLSVDASLALLHERGDIAEVQGMYTAVTRVT